MKNCLEQWELRKVTTDDDADPLEYSMVFEEADAEELQVSVLHAGRGGGGSTRAPGGSGPHSRYNRKHIFTHSEGAMLRALRISKTEHTGRGGGYFVKGISLWEIFAFHFCAKFPTQSSCCYLKI